MNQFKLDRETFLCACADFAITAVSELSVRDFGEGSPADAVVSLIERANDGNAVTPPVPDLSVWAYEVDGPHTDSSLLLVLRLEGGLQFSRLSVSPRELHPSLEPEGGPCGPESLCETLEAVLAHCDETLAEMSVAVCALDLHTAAPRRRP